MSLLELVSAAKVICIL